ncbi:AMP-binding protein [Streptomyces sp. SL13]|uniref:AMP-binding protein n=1 Tax=Streptantibioticus silvisoli TaxID=2705255 RepID=A0AA90HB23_9ACTN|nr:AMP-binding protein [Streptantibioticus silvisoli]MDI5967706.1 AMP-binding protein [Streptantibioticus silvisoli]MDI5971452.1 AMP-binding protein [Streptantibioticus silvisoli]
MPYDVLPGAPLASTAGLSYAELDRRARAVAGRLGALLPPGSPVLLVYRQGADFAGAFFGCLYAGMIAVPFPLGEPGGGAVSREGLAVAIRRVGPAAVLTAGDGWSALPVDHGQVSVLEADGVRVGGLPVLQLADRWRPVGVLSGVGAYRQYVPGRPGDDQGGRLEPVFSHADLAHVLGELHDACRLGAAEDELGWIASVQGLEDAVWRLLLPVHEGRAVWETGPLGPQP